jgi:predicted nucleotidyltransferase
MAVAQFFDEAALVAASSGILDRLHLANVLTAWFSGSLVEGLGNISSDVDIFVAISGPLDGVALTRRGADHGISATVVDGVRYDVEIWPEIDISRLADKLTSLPVHDPKRNNLHFLTYWESEFIHRLFVGVPLVDPMSFETIRAGFDKQRFATFLTDTAIRRVDDAFDDSIGMLRSGQTQMAALRARDAAGFAVDAYLYSAGVTNDKTKFRIAKLTRLIERGEASQSMLDSLWNLESYIPCDNEGLEAYIERALRLSSHIVEEVQRRARGCV